MDFTYSPTGPAASFPYWAISFTIAEPTIAPSEISAIFAACSGVEIPKPTAHGTEEFSDICRKYGVDLISLIAPTSENRVAMIAREAEGFIYIVSSLGVTGVRSEIRTDISSLVKLVRENSSFSS